MHPSPVIMTTFGGRQDRMSILLGYALEALRRGILTEYHVWNYARNEADRAWIAGLGGRHRGIRIFQPQGPPYDAYYDYYLKKDFGEAIFIKADDDIVYIDLEKLQDFITCRRSDPDTFLLSGNVVNNGVCAYFQQQHGVLPASFPELAYPPAGFCGSLWESPSLATRMHDHFLASPASFAYEGTTVAPDRLSINFISYLGRDLDHFAGIRGDDEQALSVTIPAALNRVSRIYNPLVVSHLSFYSQDPGMDTRALLEKYRAILPASLNRGKVLAYGMSRWLPELVREFFSHR
jgi:hypothetical protein